MQTPSVAALAYILVRVTVEATSSLVSEQAQGNTDSGKVFCILSLQNSILTLLQLEQLTCAGHGASEHCPQVVLSVTGGWV